MASAKAVVPPRFAYNMAINSGFDFFQEFGTGSTACADGVYACDGHYVLTQTASVNTSQTTGNVAVNALRLTQNQASAQRMGVAQVILNRISKPRRSTNVCLSAAIRYSNNAAVRFAILEWTSTADAPTKDVVNSWTSSTYTAGNFFLGSNLTVTAVGTLTPSANTWTTIFLAGAVSSSANNLYLFIWTEGTAAQNSTLDISEVVFTDGSNPVAWEPEDEEAAIARCQKFFCKTFDLTQACAQNVGISSNGLFSAVASGTQLVGTWNYPGGTMWTVPAITTYNPAAANANWRNSGNTATATNSALSTGQSSYTPASTGGTDQNRFLIHISAQAYLGV